MFGEYIFVYDRGERKFVERYRVLTGGQSEDQLKDLSWLTGTVPKDGIDTLMADLCERFPKPGFDVSRAYANNWQAVENNYAGMRNH